MASFSRFSDWPLLRRGLMILSIFVGIIIGLGIATASSPSFRTMALKTMLGTMGTVFPHDDHGFTNILLLGVGDTHHDGADLTDAMIVVSIDETTGSAVMLSLPRDLMIDSDQHIVSGRINAIYANEKRRLEYRGKLSKNAAAAQALIDVGQEIGTKLGIQIHGVVKVDFTAFTETVDALGGVDVDVPNAITDYTYPLAEGQVGLYHVDKGLQHFDGEAALKYARSRHSTTDFNRSGRQQLLLSALGAKARSLSMTDRIRVAYDIYRRLQGHIYTTLTSGQVILLAQIGSTMGHDHLVSMQMNFNVGGDVSEAKAGGFVVPAPAELYDGAAVLLPFALYGKDPNWSQIQTFAGFLLQQRRLYLAHPVIQIRDTSITAAQAWRLRNEFLRYGFDALPLDHVASGSGTTDYSGVFYRDNVSEPTATFVGHLLSLPVAHMTGNQTGSGNVILVLGKSFKFKPFVTLSGAVLLHH